MSYNKKEHRFIVRKIQPFDRVGVYLLEPVGALVRGRNNENVALMTSGIKGKLRQTIQLYNKVL